MPSIQKHIAQLLLVGAALSVGCQSAPNAPADSDPAEKPTASAAEKAKPSSTDQRVGLRIETLGIT